jgi:hypothetical protein
MKTKRAVVAISIAAAVGLTPVAAFALSGADDTQGQIKVKVASVERRGGNEPGDDRGRGRHAEPGDDHGGLGNEAGDDHGGHGDEPGDDHGDR